MAVRRLAKVAAETVGAVQQVCSRIILCDIFIRYIPAPTCYIYILHAVSRDDRVVSIFLETARQKHNFTQNVNIVCACVYLYPHVFWHLHGCNGSNKRC